MHPPPLLVFRDRNTPGWSGHPITTPQPMTERPGEGVAEKRAGHA